VKGLPPRGEEAGPLITVITAAFNASKTIEATIQSVLGQTYRNLEYIIVDGGSTDGTLDILRKYEHAIDYWISEPDRGIYDAMNKGIHASTGEWLNFMNANDLFFDCTTIKSIVEMSHSSNARFIYSDVMLMTGGDTGHNLRLWRCDHNRLMINHQASVYRKALHSEHGMYIVARRFTISDYFFFSLIDPDDYQRSERPIAFYDTTGVSQSRGAFEQKILVDHLLNGTSRPRFILYFCLYYYYRQLKSALQRLLQTLSLSRSSIEPRT
jgi:glycosyltransferase involved in cell wall biosynthesis